MPSRSGRAPLGERARSLRLVMWAVVGLGALLLLMAVAGTRGIIPPRLGAAALMLFAVDIVLILWLGARVRREALAERDRESSQAMIVLIAAQLARQEDATLERIAGTGGPAAEAALLLLNGRKRMTARGAGAAAT